MKRRTRWNIFAAAALAAAVIGVASASAAFSPRISAVAGDDGSVQMTYDLAAGDDAAQRLDLYVPVDYLYGFGDPVGSQLGTATAKVALADQGGAAATLTGSVTVAAGTQTISYGGLDLTLSSLASACIGAQPTGAFWLATLSGGGQTLTLPLYLKQLLIADPFSDTYGIELTACLPSPNVPAGTPGRAPAGMKLTQLVLDFPAVFQFVPGRSLWRLQAAPYAAGSASANAAGSVESQSLVGTPVAITVAKSKQTPNGTLLAGRVTVGGAGVAGVTVTVSRGGKVLATTKTRDSLGAFRVTAPPGSGKLTIQAAADARDYPCRYPAFGVTCVGVRLPALAASAPATPSSGS